MDPRIELWQTWRTWPNLIIPMDSVSDNVCGTFAAQYHFKIAIEAVPDEGHGCDKDVNQAFQATGTKPLINLLLICKNLGHGSNDDEGRASMFMDYRTSLHRLFARVSFPSFKTCISPIREGLARQGVEFEACADVDYAVWKYQY